MRHSGAKIPFTVISGVACTNFEKVSQKLVPIDLDFHLKGKEKHPNKQFPMVLWGLVLIKWKAEFLNVPLGFSFFGIYHILK